jgi:hypothetical protein
VCCHIYWKKGRGCDNCRCPVYSCCDFSAQSHRQFVVTQILKKPCVRSMTILTIYNTFGRGPGWAVPSKMKKFVPIYPMANVVDTIREPLLLQETESSVVGNLPAPSNDTEITLAYPVQEQDNDIVVAVPDPYFPNSRCISCDIVRKSFLLTLFYFQWWCPRLAALPQLKAIKCQLVKFTR